MSEPEKRKKFVTLRDILAWIAIEGVKAIVIDKRNTIHIRTPLELARASARKALCDVRAYLEHGDDAAISAANGITARKP